MSGVADPCARPCDPGFKLFGRTIPVLLDCATESYMTEEGNVIASVSNAHSCFQDIGDEVQESEEESVGGSVPDELGSSSGSNDGCDEEKRSDGLETVFDNPGSSAACVPRSAAESNDADSQKNGHDALKKPEKPIACPRCDSRDTKFCYFNNYNISQPRHFCKNCQRYWTAGGSLRNVPVGAGRRKNKYPLPDGLVGRGDPPDSAQQSCPVSSLVGLNRHLKPRPSPPQLHLLPLEAGSHGVLDSPSSRTVLNFEQESPVGERTRATSSDLHRAHVLRGYSAEVLQGQGTLNGKACSSAKMDAESSNMSTSLCQQFAGKSAAISTPTAQHLVPLSRMSTVDPPTPVDTWSSFGWTTGAPLTCVGGPLQCSDSVGWSSSPALTPSSKSTGANAPQALVSVNNSAWGAGLWAGAPWPLMQNPIVGPPSWSWAMPLAPASAEATNPLFRNSTLGKHPREHESEKGGSLLVPKTIRIAEPVEAARSSIWKALGLRNGSESITSSGIFRAFHPKAGSK